MLLYVVLLLVLGAFGLLVVALTTAQTLWAWGSVLLSVSAAMTLLIERRRRRADAVRSGAESGPVLDDEGSGSDAGPQGDTGGPGGQQATGELEGAPTGGALPVTGSDGQAEPGEEDTDAADALVVSELADEVRVVDERPRYHLCTCAWLVERATLALPIKEARQLGFTPCARCAPDSTLAAMHRAAR